MTSAEQPLRRVVRAWIPAVAYMVVIWLVSSMSQVDVPLDRVPWRDKGVHFVEYAVLGWLVAHAVKRSLPQLGMGTACLLAIVITSLWGVIDEIHQAFVPGRTSDAKDVVADVLGALFGAGLWRLWQAVRQGQRRTREAEVGTPVDPG